MATRVVEGKKPYTGGKAISIDENKVISLNLRDENNLIIYDEGDDEIYVDLQLEDGIEPTDAFPVGVNVGRVLIADDWDVNGTLVVFKTTSGDNIKLLYGDDGKLYIDNGTGLFKQIYLKGEVDALLQALKDYTDAQLALKQDILIAGEYIEIEDNVISAVIPTMSRFLSIWNASTGQPISFPASVPFTYHTGDYYLVENVDTVNNPPVNYRPDGYEYTGDVSHTLEPDLEIADGDVYIYDGSAWLLQENHNKTVAFANIAGDPYDNTNLSTALNAKANTTDVLTKSNTTSYTPSGNYNPATKKYVDDGLSNKQATLVSGTNIKSINSNSLLGSGNLSIAEVPSGGTNGQVLTQTSQGPAWQNATGGDVLVSTQANNIFTPGMKIWGGTESDYQSLTPDSNTAYLLLANQPTPPSPWQPGANTIAYYPLTTNGNDATSNHYDLTVGTGITFGANGAVFPNQAVGGLTGPNGLTVSSGSSFTISQWINLTKGPQGGTRVVEVHFDSSMQLANNAFYLGNNTLNHYIGDTWTPNSTFNENTWYNLIYTNNNNSVKVYLNGVQTDTGTLQSSLTSQGIIWGQNWGNNDGYAQGNMKDIIIEDKEWSAQDVADYFDQTKGDYGIS